MRRRPPVLIWPQAFPRHTVEVDFNRPVSSFRLVRAGDHFALTGLSERLILDPFREASFGEFGLFIATSCRFARCTLVQGLLECRRALADHETKIAVEKVRAGAWSFGKAVRFLETGVWPPDEAPGLTGARPQAVIFDELEGA